MFLTENIGKNIGKILSENLRGEYTQEHLGHAKQSATDALKTFSKRIIKKKTAGATCNLIGSKDANKKISKTSQQNNPETVTNEHDKEIPKERYISLSYSWSKINIIV